MEMTEKVFEFVGGKVCFAHSQLEYYSIRKQFRDLADESRSEVLANFYTRFDSFDAMANGLGPYLNEFLEKGAVLCAKIMAVRDHYELDPERFIADFFDKSRLEQASQHFRDFISAQQTEAEENESERSARTEALGNAWEGGGFGLEGAVKGAIQAEALNLAGAAVSGIFNAASRNREAQRHLEEQKAFFEDNQTASAFADGVYCALAEMYIDLFDYVDKNCPEITIKRLTNEDIAKAKALLSNIQKGFIPEEKILENCRKVLSLNPLFSEAYEFILIKYPESKNVILEMDEFFDIGVISKKMHELLAEYYATLKLNCEEDAWNARKLMAEKAEELGIKDYTNYAELEQLISKFDKEYRTLDSVVYATRELADKKRALKTFYQTLAIDTEENALNARKLMAEKAKELELEDYESYPALEEVIAKFDLAERTIAGRVFDSREEALLQRNAYKLYTEANFCDSEENALKAKEALAAFAEKNSIDVSWLMIDIDVALKHFDEELRIVFDYMYASREEAQAAQSDENLFFRAIWSYIHRCVKDQSWAKNNAVSSISSLVSKVQTTINSQVDGQKYSEATIAAAKESCGLSESELLFHYISNEVFPSGKVGMAITSKGLTWNNGSAIISQIASNKLFKRFMGAKADEMQEKNKVKTCSITWQELLTSARDIEISGNNDIVFPNDEVWKVCTIEPTAFVEVFNKIRLWQKMTNIQISDASKDFSNNVLQDYPRVTDLPKLK